MGLDMYLMSSDYYEPDETEETMEQDYKAWSDNFGKSQRAYWRKANQIHAWFVDNVQGGVDECQTTRVTRLQLEGLVELCKRVLANHDLAEEYLPTRSGFFFGGTEYDEYYFQELEDTVNMLTPLVESNEPYFQYSASW
jgi:hypothetical protein